jgi:hypothetical protein
MYGLRLDEMLFVWTAVSGALAIVGLLLGCILVGLTPKRPQFFPQPAQPWVWSEEVWTEGDREEFYPLIDQLADEGEYELWRDRDIGKVYRLPLERRDVA